MRLNIVPARSGVIWVRKGLQTFFRQPMGLAGLFFLFMAVMSLLSLVPWLGTVLMLALLPLATLGFMAATRQCADGQFRGLLDFARTQRTPQPVLRPLLILGALYALLFLTAVGLTTLLDDGLFARFYLAGQKLTPEQMSSNSFQSALWLAMALNLPLSLMFWHAPALVHWHGVTPVKALFFSLVACVRNLGAYLVFGLTWFSLFTLVVMLTVGVLGTVIGPDAAAAILMPGISLFMALFFTSLYFTFEDTFIADLPVPGDLT